MSKYTYNILLKKYSCTNAKRESKWEELFGHQPKEKDWSIIHTSNFCCTIETQLRSFYFKIFHNAIGFNAFLFKIGRKESANCYFCSDFPETLDHLFCDCRRVVPLWEKLVDKINTGTDHSYNLTLSKFNFLFGIQSRDKYASCINFLCLCLKYYIYSCRFQGKELIFEAFVSMVKFKQKIEYKIAQKKNKLQVHFKKWSIKFN